MFDGSTKFRVCFVSKKTFRTKSELCEKFKDEKWTFFFTTSGVSQKQFKMDIEAGHGNLQICIEKWSYSSSGSSEGKQHTGCVTYLLLSRLGSHVIFKATFGKHLLCTS